jgi:hypothetical protein
MGKAVRETIARPRPTLRSPVFSRIPLRSIHQNTELTTDLKLSHLEWYKMWG